MADNIYNIGDVVILTGYNEGEIIRMTVNNIDVNDVECVWFDKRDTLQRSIFNKSALEKLV